MSIPVNWYRKYHKIGIESIEKSGNIINIMI